MKKLAIFLLPTFLLGAPVGNPAAPSVLHQGVFISDKTWCQPKASFTEDFTSGGQLTCTKSSADVQKTFMSGNSQLASATWSIRERLDLSATFGTSRSRLRLFEEAQLVEFQTSGGLVWFGDAKLILVEMKDTSFSVFGEAGGWNWMNGPQLVNQMPVAGDAHLSLLFWQAGASFSQRIGYFSPYIGIAVLETSWKVKTDGLGTYRFSQSYDTGPIVGCTLSTSSQFSLNAEWRGWFENGLSLSGEMRF